MRNNLIINSVTRLARMHTMTMITNVVNPGQRRRLHLAPKLSAGFSIKPMVSALARTCAGRFASACVGVGAFAGAVALNTAFSLPVWAAALTPVPEGMAQARAPQAFVGQGELAAAYANNGKIAQIQVETDKNGLPADGQSALRVSIKVLDKDGQPVQGKLLLTLETSGGRILLDAAATDTLGPQGGDLDRVTPGVQLALENGQASFRLLAPSEPQDVLLRVSGGNVVAQGIVSFVPELRQMLAAGLIEGIISRRSLSADALAPTRINDGFEQDITRWSRQFNQGKANAAVRTAFFLKGKIQGDKLLTAAYDSDQPTRDKLQRDINPNEFYPVYGDSAISGFDARSSNRLYVRIDDQKSYLLYGDFSTGESFTSGAVGGFGSGPGFGTSVGTSVGPNVGSNVGSNVGLQARKLGQYQRNVTGLRGHWEGASGNLNGFAFHDNLKQVIEEYQANGTSGPFAVKNNNAISNSERVEIIVRDKHQSDLIKQVTPLRRLDDYSFEPFSGRILFKQAVPAQSPEGDPQSVRITYEVEQGGDDFWVLGFDGQWHLSERATLGAAVVDDKNPLSPYRLQSLFASVKLGQNSRLVAEVAHTDSTSYRANGQVFTTPSGQAGELASSASGRAARIALAHKDEQWDASLEWQRAGAEFNNSAAGISPGHSDLGVKLAHKVTPDLTVYGNALRSQDTLVAAKREAARLGLQFKASERLTFDVSLQHIKEDGDLANGSLVAGNSAPLPGEQNPNGGFFGFGNNNSAISPISGTSVITFAPVGSTPAAPANIHLDANTLALGLGYQASANWRFNALAEGAIGGGGGSGGSRQHRFELGTQYQLSERSRAYARYENQTGLASRYSLNPAEKSNAFVAGVESSYLPGASVFTEYRLRDAIDTDSANARDLQLASGLRNTWNLAEGVAASTNAEYLHVFDGKQQKGVALAGGLDYTANPLWKASAKLEWRRLFDNRFEPGNQIQDQWLNTLSVAKKLDRDWTVLARNYLLYTRNHDNSSGAAMGSSLQERAQLGFAWRPVDNNRVNGLARYEFKNVRDDAQSTGESYTAHIVSAHLDYHPSRPWWMTGRVAAKTNHERRLPQGQQTYNAWLLGGRVVYDISENWDIGILASWLHSPQGGTSQYARGIEAGYLVKENLWLSLGYNLTGFSERDLNGADYTAKGVYLRLRFKFDENLFKGSDPAVNRSLAR